MAIGKYADLLGPWLTALALVAIFARSAQKQRIALGLGLLFPGLGHLWLKERSRGTLFAALIVPVFLVGLVLTGFAGVSPFDRHTLWGLAQFPGGGMTLVTWLLTLDVRIERYDGIYQVGSLYLGAACLLNVLALCDAWDIAGGRLPKAPAPNPAQGGSPAEEPHA